MLHNAGVDTEQDISIKKSTQRTLLRHHFALLLYLFRMHTQSRQIQREQNLLEVNLTEIRYHRRPSVTFRFLGKGLEMAFWMAGPTGSSAEASPHLWCLISYSVKSMQQRDLSS